MPAVLPPKKPVFLSRTTLCGAIAVALLATSAAPVYAQNKRKTTSQQTVQGSTPYATRPEAMQFADDVAQRRNIDPEWARNTVSQARLLANVPKLVLPPPRGTAKNWRVYRSRFIDPVRIQAGVRFWARNEAALAQAEREYGVPADIIVGIIGVETIYGQQMGNFRVVDALATLAFDFPAAHPRAAERTEFFKRELEQFLSFTYRSSTDPFTLRGSYAGAMGLGQFMPSSWVKYAVDFDGDGKVDLFNSSADAIGSVANYFKGYGWTPGMPTHYEVTLNTTPAQLDELLVPDILPTFSASQMQAKGAALSAAGAAHTGPLALVELQNGPDAPSYVAGTENFYTITRYNWSSYYAMAVIELAQEVAAARQATKSVATTP
jgi:membrane-bound lytic murein transglycosylase B